ncbi:MAG: DNA-formamidopyrimidine glycosylase [Firmicutes bacterium]|jgi:formamidopyrimidine-DNA glycosylase|nr:DNA-formamidopyrimidine glycosylase [Bacillota bacterium]
MPELPEVEIICSGLECILPGKKVAAVEVHYPRAVKIPTAAELQEKLPGRTVVAVKRRGKYLQIFFDCGTVLVVHLRMTGRLLFFPAPQKWDKHTHVLFHFCDGSVLAFHDVRKFGTIYWVTPDRFSEIHGLHTLGPEPLSPDFTADYLQKQAKRRKTSIKALLLNQRVVAGLGNIYTDEALYRAGIRPDRPAASLSAGEIAALHRSIRAVLREAIYYRGTTMSDYRDATGREGSFQEHLRVYRRGGRPCPCCGHTIVRIVVGGRGTYFCPRCQR